MTHFAPVLTPATLAILANLGEGQVMRRAASVTDPGRTATGPAEPVTDFLSTKSASYHRDVTPAHALPLRMMGSDTWEERAAILEYEGGHARSAAERMASLLLSVNQMDGSSAETCALDRELIEMDRRRG